MEFTSREWWAVIHGLVLGTLYLLAFGGALAGLWSLRPGLVTAAGIRERLVRLYLGFGVMAVTAWLTVISGTWKVYPWYRVKLAGDDGAGCAGLNLPSTTCSPRDFLVSNVSGDTKEWHHFGMEWKEYVAWATPCASNGTEAHCEHLCPLDSNEELAIGNLTVSRLRATLSSGANCLCRSSCDGNPFS